jgi:hypothetical protein
LEPYGDPVVDPDLFGVARSTVYRTVGRERTRHVMGVGTTVG